MEIKQFNESELVEYLEKSNDCKLYKYIQIAEYTDSAVVFLKGDWIVDRDVIAKIESIFKRIQSELLESTLYLPFLSYTSSFRDKLPGWNGLFEFTYTLWKVVGKEDLSALKILEPDGMSHDFK